MFRNKDETRGNGVFKWTSDERTEKGRRQERKTDASKWTHKDDGQAGGVSCEERKKPRQKILNFTNQTMATFEKDREKRSMYGCPIVRAIDVGYGNTKYVENRHFDQNREIKCGTFPSLAPKAQSIELFLLDLGRVLRTKRYQYLFVHWQRGMVGAFA